MEEIFGLPFINNPIPAAETNNFNGYNTVATVADLSDLFVSGAIPAPANLSAAGYHFQTGPKSNTVSQVVQITNNGSTPVSEPLFLALDNLVNATLANADGTTALLAPLGSPYVNVSLGENGILRPHEIRTVKLEFSDPGNAVISYTVRVLNVTPAP